MLRIVRWGAALAVSAMLALPAAVQANVINYDLSFETSGQSIWDTGNSFTLDKSTFLGVGWQNLGVNVNAIAGSDDTTIFNPLRGIYDLAFAACRLVASSSACINGQSGRIPVARLGSRPRVRSCGRFAVACKIARAADFVRRAAYDVAFSACRRVASSSACRNGQSARLPVVALGTAPASTLNLDTRTGVALDGTISGRVGLELGIQIDSGSVDATVTYAAELDIPDTMGLDKAIPINFNPNSALAGVNTLNTSFANLTLSLDAIAEMSGSVNTEACFIGAGCVTDSSLIDINERAPILALTNTGAIEVFGKPPSEIGLSIPDGFPVTFDLGVVDVTLHVPQPNANGGLDTMTGTLKATGTDDFLDIIVDVDDVVATAAGVPGFFGSSYSVGPPGILGASIGYDIIDVKIGPTIDLQQDFELDPTLFVEFVFDQAVMVGGQLVTVLESAWDLLPDITFLSNTTTVTPTFFIDASLLNQTLLDFDFSFLVDLLQIKYKFPLGTEQMIGIGNILGDAVDLFKTPNLYENLFPLNGFNALVGNSFIIDFLTGSTEPASSQVAFLANDAPPDVIDDPLDVPEPATIFLFLAGLCLLYGLQWRERNFRPALILYGTRPSSMA